MINRLKTGEYHFVLNSNLKNKIIKFGKLLDLNLSKTIIFMIENIYSIAWKMHFYYEEENNKIENVNWDSHIHIYYNKQKNSIYSILKSIHKDNNTYSIANNLRLLIKIFIRGQEIYGFEKFMLILKNSKAKWETNLKRSRVWRKNKKVRQLSKKPFINIQYNTNYQCISIRLIN
jgi:hypothetical protein